MLEDKWLVQILVKDSDGDWTIGTGYPIGNGVVLTANHVVSFTKRNAIPQFTLVWHKQEYLETPFTIVFQDEQLDLAIIHYSETTPFKAPQVTLADRVPKINKLWSTRGFPKAGKIGTVSNQAKANEVGKTRESIPNVGVVAGIRADGVIELHTGLKIKSAAVKEENKDWAGLSGSPVFIDDKLVAVITHEYKTIEGLFLAVSIPSLLATNPDFKAKSQPIDEEAIKKQTRKLHDKIKANISRLLQENFTDKILREFLKGEKDKSIDELIEESLIVDKTGKSMSVLDSISVITRILKKYPPNRIDEVEEIAGWLLTNSVDPVWWFHHEQQMKQATGKLNLKEPDYIEVIISRSFFRPAQYMLEKSDKPDESDKSKLGNPKPFKTDDKNIRLPLIIYDADDESTDQILLTPIYKDLWNFLPPPNHPVDDLIERIVAAAESKRDNQEGKLIYYLVTPAYLEILESKDWFLKAQAELAGCLRFICCAPKEQLTEENPCSVKQISVLAKVKDFLQALEYHRKE